MREFSEAVVAVARYTGAADPSDCLRIGVELHPLSGSDEAVKRFTHAVKSLVKVVCEEGLGMDTDRDLISPMEGDVVRLTDGQPPPPRPRSCRHRDVKTTQFVQGSSRFRVEVCEACGAVWRFEECPTCRGGGWVEQAGGG